MIYWFQNCIWSRKRRIDDEVENDFGYTGGSGIGKTGVRCAGLGDKYERVKPLMWWRMTKTSLPRTKNKYRWREIGEKRSYNNTRIPKRKIKLTGRLIRRNMLIKKKQTYIWRTRALPKTSYFQDAKNWMKFNAYTGTKSPASDWEWDTWLPGQDAVFRV